MLDFVSALTGADSVFSDVYVSILRWAAPAIGLILLLRCALPLLTFRREPEIWAWVNRSDGRRDPVTHWENVIGRSRSSDIQIDFPTVSRNHGVLTRYDDGSWTVTDAHSKDGLFVNGERVDICALEPGDVISIGGIDLTLEPASGEEEQMMSQSRTKAGNGFGSVANLMLLSLFQILCCMGFVLGTGTETGMSIVMAFGVILICQWMLLLFYICIKRASFEVETMAFFLCTLGMCAIASTVPEEVMKQVAAFLLGLVIFLLIGWSLRDLERAKAFRYLATAAGIGFLVITLLFGDEYYGAKNWLTIGSYSVQPSEFSKVCFVYAGASAMDRIMNKRNLILFIGYSVVMCGCLTLMNDFGAALIFFAAFLVVAYMRSGSVGTIGLACASLGFAGVVALKVAPHALKRFETWRHIWEVPLDGGYQQTRALMCMASGGFLGLGPGKGWMKNVFAADSDMVVATVSEEWGLFMVLLMIACIVTLGLFAVRSASVGRSSFYVIGACTAASILMIQVILNALGTVDIVPLTGVTFPFVSNGGSSMICSWGLLAFVKAADTRQNASFAVRLSRLAGGHYE